VEGADQTALSEPPMSSHLALVVVALFEVRFEAHCGLKSDIALGPESANDRDRGEPCSSAPPTPPCVRVRTRRFEKLR
jgi:hypothetical protein